MEQLKHYRQLLLGNIETGDSGRSPAALLELISQELEDMRKQKEKSGLLSRPENRLYRQTISTIEAWSQKLRTLPEKASEEAWQWVRGRFMEESDAYEDVKDACGEKLEHAFDFMEAAFGNAQEMVIFITELNTGEAAVEFLNSYECGRYYQYNKALLFDEQEKGILEKIK